VRSSLARTRVRLTLAYALVFATVAAVAATGTWFLLRSTELNSVDASLSAQAQALASGIDDQNGHVTFQGGDTLPGQTPAGIAISALILDASGTVLDASGSTVRSDAVASLVGPTLSQGSQTATVRSGGITERFLTQPLSLTQGQHAVLVVGRPIDEVQDTLTRVGLLLLLTVAGLTVVASGLGYWLAGRALRPVRVIAATAREISEHDLHRRITLQLPPDELGELAATFNDMLARLEASFEGLRRFTSDAAHELRAPLALLRAEAEVALAAPRSSGEYRQAIQTMLDEVIRLARMADQLLLLARADAGALGMQRADVDLGRLVDDSMTRWGPRAVSHRIQIAEDVRHDVVTADPDLLRRVLDNLVDNALRHTPDGGRIGVSAYAASGVCTVIVEDSGPGVSQELRATLFERFTRADGARQRETGGAGLGLSLVAAIVVAHGGSIRVEDPASGGARFVIELPSGARTGAVDALRPVS
jgi:heavy metal sensor kinase